MTKNVTSPAHTTGPWTLFRSKDWKEGEYEVLHKESWGHRLVCRMEDAYRSSDEGEQHLANARLIAAAPDLLEACLFALESGDDHEAMKKMQAAIAKAQGK